MLLIVLAIAWMTGIAAAQHWTLPTPMLWFAAGVGLVGAIASARIRPAQTASLCMMCLALAGVRTNAAQHDITFNDVQLLLGAGDVHLQGVVHADPKRTEEGQQLVLRTEAAHRDGQIAATTGLVLVNLPPYPTYRYGQRLMLLGALKQPRAAERPGQFDYRAYLERKGIFVLMREPLVQTLPGNAGNPFFTALLGFRDHCRSVLMRVLPEPQSALAIGILLGLQSSIPENVYTAFSITGLTHILVVSGWNFTIVAALLAGVATRLRLGRGTTFWMSLAVMWTYAFFVGAAPAVLRAAVMASLMVLALTTERRSEPWTLLFAACWCMTAVDPNTLWDIGFQLSALATASLFAFAKPTEQWLQRCPPLRWPLLALFTEALTATLAAQILALPIILYHFGNLSVIAPLANVLVVPIVPYAMLLGTVALVGGLVWLPLGQWLALGVWLPLTWMSEGALFLAQVPGAAQQIPPFPLWLLLSYYGIVVGWWLWQQWALAEDEDREQGTHFTTKPTKSTKKGV